MKWVRFVLGALLGYVLAALTNNFWVMFWYVGRASSGDGWLVAGTVLMFLLSGLAAGWVVARSAGTLTDGAATVAAALIVVAGIVNLSMGDASAPSWHTLTSVLLQAPALVVGSRLRPRARTWR